MNCLVHFLIDPFEKSYAESILKIGIFRRVVPRFELGEDSAILKRGVVDEKPIFERRTGYLGYKSLFKLKHMRLIWQ